jgi:hypothetical protein
MVLAGVTWNAHIADKAERERGEETHDTFAAEQS